ncbi:hypothetical protein RI129_012629 [Pyrocoelia pectoralis]|uniref:Uncharacterized protein n=1 Tax=Pyrocoelia pectoralis TaxID=417401 RepID=A0AAN7V0S7_9COLE
MKVFLLAILFVCLAKVALSEDKSRFDLLEKYVKALSEESVLNFKLIASASSYHENGTPKYVDTLAFGSDHNSSAVFKLNSLGPNRIEKFKTHASSKGVSLVLFHENFNKNKTKDYDTDFLSTPSSPAAEVISNKEGIDLGILEELIETVDETTNEGKIEGNEYFPSKKLKQRTTLTFKAKEVTVKGNKDFSSKMLEDGKKLIKRAFKIDTDDRATVIASLFDEKLPGYNWEVYINPITYTVKSEVMAKFNYDNVNYVVLGTY